MNYVYNDGGRGAAGFDRPANDCVTRAICIITGKPYREVWDYLAAHNGNKSADHCIHTGRRWFFDYMVSIGFTWVAPKKKLYVRDLLKGDYIVHVARHYFAVLNSEIHDTHPVGDRKIVKGYWLYKKPATSTFNVFKGETQLNRYPLNLLQAITMRNLYALNYGGNPEIKPNA